MSGARKNWWATASPEERSRHLAKMAAARAAPEVRARMTAAIAAAFRDPEARARNSAAQKAAWADPEKRARRLAGIAAARCDPAWEAKRIARRYPHLAPLTPRQRSDYRLLRRKLLTVAEALAAVGRADLIPLIPGAKPEKT